jgi:hypothetical protein
VANNRLFNVLTFPNVGPGASVALPHLLSNNGKLLVPDYGWVNNPDFTAIADNTNVTVTNTSAAISTVEVWVNAIHTLIRVLGGTSIPDLPVKPYWLIGAGGTSGTGGLPVVQRYVCTGAEGTDFFVVLTVPRANDQYSVSPALAFAATSPVVGINCPDEAAPGTDRTTIQFRVVTSAPLIAGDFIDFTIQSR